MQKKKIDENAKSEPWGNQNLITITAADISAAIVIDQLNQ
jgi:hypothetical protein